MIGAELQGDYFNPEMSGNASLGESPNERVGPSRFSNGDDSFMASMIANYALEGKNDDETPNGKFFMDKTRTKSKGTLGRARQHQARRRRKQLEGA